MKNTKYEYPWQGMLIVTILGFAGVGILIFTKILEIRSITDFINYFSINGIPLIFCSFFIFISIYVWISFIKNVLIKPKKEVLYLLEIEDDLAKFINKNGKIYYFENENFSINEYYDVLKTHDIVKQVLGKSLQNFDVKKEKKNYWLNFYSPMGKFENIMILPIAYILLTPGIIQIIFSSGFQKLIGIFIILPPLFLILYDLIYKIKLNKNENSEIDNSKFIKFYILFRNIVAVIASIFIFMMFLILFLNISDTIGKIIFIPFLLAAVCAVCQTIAKVFNNSKWFTIFKKMYLIVFLLYWFGLLSIATFTTIKQGEYKSLSFLLPLLLVGIIIFYNGIIRKK